MTSIKFKLGQIVATPGALEVLEAAGQQPLEFLSRHLRGDWGDLDDEDKALNDAALIDGSRILSSYKLANSEKLWIISEATNDEGVRASTCVLKPDEY